MNLDDYQERALRTAVYPAHVGMYYTILGLCGEAGELANVYKKHLRDGGALVSLAHGLTGAGSDRRNKMIDELGDCLWYIAAIAKELNTSLDHVATSNLFKLATRANADTLKHR